MQDAGQVTAEEHRVRVLVPRQEVTGADRQWAERYEPGDVVRYTKGSEASGLDAREYARVEHVNAKENLLTVERSSGERVTYDPRRLQGVTVYREAERAFAVGDRVQFTAPDRDLHVANRELATIERITGRADGAAAAFVSTPGAPSRLKSDQPHPSRLRLRRHEPQQPGPDRRPRPRPHRHRAWRRAPGQPAPGVRRRLPRPVRRADLHERQGAARARHQPGRLAQRRD